MDYVLNTLIGIFVIMVIVKIYMVVARYVGEQLGIGKFIKYLLQKIQTKK
nr:hypothetical protein [Sedimentibacter sp.]